MLALVLTKVCHVDVFNIKYITVHEVSRIINRLNNKTSRDEKSVKHIVGMLWYLVLLRS